MSDSLKKLVKKPLSISNIEWFRRLKKKAA